MSIVAKDKVVQIHYVLTGDDGTVLDASGEHPLSYLHGHSNIVSGLEKALEGKAVGDDVEAILPPEEAYGLYDAAAVQSVHRRELPSDAKLEVGRPLRAEGSAGQVVTLWVTAMKGARVTLTTNHPLAGKTLNFRVQIAGIRDGSPEEIEHGHVHGAGHQH